jgi:hypothetical protein
MGKYVVASQMCLPKNYQKLREIIFQRFNYSINLLLTAEVGAEFLPVRNLVSFPGNPNWKGKYFTSRTYREREVSA